MKDVSDGQLARIMGVGSLIGMVVLFGVTVAIALLAGVSLGDAVGIAIVPTFFGGWFYGGTILLLRAAYGEQRSEANVSAEAHSEAPSSAAEAPSSAAEADRQRRAA